MPDRVDATDERSVTLLRALANPQRLRMVRALAHRKELTAAQLQDEVAVAQSMLFEHLATLRDAGIVQSNGSQSSGARTWCLNPDALHFLTSVLGGYAESETDGRVTTRTGETVIVRQATPDDAARIAAIYNQGIADRVATLETVERTPEERAEWMAAKGPRHPVIVAEDDAGTVVGWASLNSFSPRPAYDHVADISVYVDREERGRGIGDTLLTALEERARTIGFHKLVLAAFPTNAPGMRLYGRQGFVTVGIYREQGLLDNRWVDTIVMEKLLA